MDPEEEELPLSGKRWLWVLGGLIVVLVVALMVSMIPRGYNQPEGDPANAAQGQMGAMNGAGMNGSGMNGGTMNGSAMNSGSMQQGMTGQQGVAGGTMNAPAATPSAAASGAQD